ncbi:MAG: Translation initiation factor IF-2 [Chroococcopsis gigantea SAG 12.99]|jgi:translation initiation factor IF-2|nr:translation initiation factor IF-2 [Chlorogloea purpurea SAG 13.99]MDV2999504.1 Translation initiation factor IF-2 [Chroococcopsis gigantea SAG 12.99]
MNNAKVRIYDLSKELNLDNNDVLDICKQLEIAVKSHSSTITEEQAEQIRTAAPKHQPVAGKVHHGQERSHQRTENKTKEAPVIDKKPQIRAIHHRPGSTETVEQPKPSKSLTPPAMTINANSTLVKPEPETATVTPEVIEVTEDPTEIDNSAKISHNQSKPVTAKEALKEPNSTPVDQNKLLEPPSRSGAKPGGETIPSRSVRTEAPKLITSPAPQSVNGDKPRRERPEKPEKPERAAKPTNGDRPARSERVERQDKPEKLDKPALKLTLKPQQKGTEPGKETAEVKRPPRQAIAPKPPVSAANSGDDIELLEIEESDTEELGADGVSKPTKATKIKRPIPPQKKRAPWEEEEEEEKAKTAKLAKNTGKAKRRSQVLFDEDEDLDSQLEETGLAQSFSLSIARPPKPKSTTPAKTTAPVAVNAIKVKKTGKTETAQSRRAAERKEVKEEQSPESIVVQGSLTVRELSELLKVPETEIIRNLFFKGMAVNITQTLDKDTIKVIAEELGVKIEAGSQTAAATKVTEMLDASDLENLQHRPPVVTIMGHVDHGKTTLLDSIRKTKVAQGEAGGITQHIGAYHVDVEHNGVTQQIVFLDTPGHEAFTAMRARGARVTDIAILVVAADDGVQPQTKEAISHAKAAEVPIIVAINKVDKPDSNPDRIKQELAEQGLVPEDWGGDTIMVPVSALKGQNLDNLLEMIILVSEIEELSANPNRAAKGTVIEANLDRTKGPVATLLVQNGTLRVGDCIVAGSVFGKIRAMIDDRGEKVDAASPSFAVEVLGLSDVPSAGDEFDVFESEKDARALADQRFDAKRQSRLQQVMSARRVSLATLSAQVQEGQLKELNLILKADVQGSVEAILSSLNQLPQNEVQLRILLCAPGEITETDVDLAAASGAVILGFNTTLASGARAAADQEGVDIRDYNIIYKLLDDVQGAMEGLLDPEEVEEHLGQAEVRAVFTIGRGAVAGCYVQSGKLVRNRLIRIRRKGQIVYQGGLESLKRMKEDAREVNAGYECGVGVSKFNDWQEGDIIEAYEMLSKRRTLSPN